MLSTQAHFLSPNCTSYRAQFTVSAWFGLYYDWATLRRLKRVRVYEYQNSWAICDVNGILQSDWSSTISCSRHKTWYWRATQLYTHAISWTPPNYQLHIIALGVCNQLNVVIFISRLHRSNFNFLSTGQTTQPAAKNNVDCCDSFYNFVINYFYCLFLQKIRCVWCLRQSWWS